LLRGSRSNMRLRLAGVRSPLNGAGGSGEALINFETGS
jgi:hypothetical protein